MKLLLYWHKLWADFDDEVSFNLTKDRVRVFLATTPWRFLAYSLFLTATIFTLLGLCNLEVYAPTRDPTPTPE